LLCSIQSVKINPLKRQVLKVISRKASAVRFVYSVQRIASEVVNGKRAISKAQAKGLAEHFGVSVEVFI
jgi:antitoxin component HigA of HigAB toxin-antitoxin module